MTKIVLILSVLVMAVTAVLGVLNLNLFKAERDEKDRVHRERQVVKEELNGTEDTLADTKGKLSDFKDERDEGSATLSNAKADLDRKKYEVQKLQAGLDESNLKLKEFKVVLEKYKGKSVEDLKDRLESMAQDITNKTAELEKIETELATANTAVDSNQGALETHAEKQVARSAGIARNAFKATITAVNSDWGFVIINAGKKKGVTPESPLLVSANGKRIARLNIISIEPDITVADIDQDSLSRGTRVQPGHTVMYQNVNE